MAKIIIAGMVNIETTMAIKKFPVAYQPVDYNFFGIDTSVSGVGMNVAKALKTLGSDPFLLSVISRDFYGDIITSTLETLEIEHSLSPMLESTPQSVIFYDDEGRRRINLDLKNIQDVSFPIGFAEKMLAGASLAAICNVNFSRELLRLCKTSGIKIATDVHVVSDVGDEYNKAFMESADILFMSNETIIGHERDFMNKLIGAYDNEIIVIGMGAEGALMHVRESGGATRYPAQKTRPAVNTAGAGDALFSSFIHYYNKYHDPYGAIKKALIFASYKIGENGAANGFLREDELEKLDSSSCVLA